MTKGRSAGEGMGKEMEELDIYCGQLGMVIHLAYCISANEGLPCRMSIGCWSGRVDLAGVLHRKFTEGQLKKAFGGLPKSRMERILEAVPQRKREE